MGADGVVPGLDADPADPSSAPLPTTLRGSAYGFTDDVLHDKFEHALDGLKPGTTDVEFMMHLDRPATGLEVGAYIVQASNLGAGFSLKTIAGAKWMAETGQIDPEIAFQVRWSNAP